MNEFFKSKGGRLMALAFAVSLLGGGTSALVPPGYMATFLFCSSLFVPIVISFNALSLALAQHWYEAVLAAILLPVLLFLWAVGLGVIRELHHEVLAYPALALGFTALAMAARPTHVTPVLPARLVENH